MDLAFGSDKIGFEITELSTALVEYFQRSFENIQAKAKADELTAEDFAAEQGALYDQCAELSHLFADRFRGTGNADWATLCDTWASGFERNALAAKSAVASPNAALEYFKNSMSSLSIFDEGAVLSGQVGQGAGPALSKAFKLPGFIDKAFQGWEFAQDWFKGDATAMAGVAASFFLGNMLTEAAAGIIVTLGGGAVVTGLVLIAAGVTLWKAGDLIKDGVNDFLEIFGGEDEADAAEAIQKALKSGNSVYLPHVGDQLFFGTSGDDKWVGTSGIKNDAVGGDGDDIIFGADMADFLSGGAGNDTLHGGAGFDKLKGGDGDDLLDGGAGSDTLVGGKGYDTYVFTTEDLTAQAVDDYITDEDGVGTILFNGQQISGTGIGFDTIHEASFGTWDTSDHQFSLVWRDAEKSLVIIHKASGSRIIVRNWKNGDLGISIPGFDETHPNDSSPLTNNDDVFGHNGNNNGADHLNALAGNDGISAGAGDDVVDGGLGDDLIFGGSGNDRLSGGDGNDFLIDGSELVDMEDWSDTVGSDGKSERQRMEAEIASLGSAVLSKGKGWYIKLSDGGFIIVTKNQTLYPDPEQHRSGDDFLDGGDGDDQIIAGEGNDTIEGGRGNDFITGGHDDDLINGGDGDDIIYGDVTDSAIAGFHFGALVSADARKNGNDYIDGGAGNDQVAGGGGNDNIFGGLGDDIISGRGSLLAADDGDADRDYIDGGAGKDYIAGDDGDDIIFGGDDDDIIRGDNNLVGTRHGNDTIDGGAGNDHITGDGGDDKLTGGDGDDTLIGDAFDIAPTLSGSDFLDGGAGNDTLFGGGGDDVLIGGDGNDILLGDADESELAAQYHGDDFLSGGAGDDELQGGGGNDVLDGGTGNDRLFGQTGNDNLAGGEGNDILNGGDGDDLLDGGAGDDELYGADGDDSLSGGMGKDKLFGGTGKDTLSGGDDDDTLSGEDGDDVLDGGAGNDQMWGGAGNDRLTGGDGDDYLDGDDSQVAAALHGNDTIDGGAGNDIIHGLGGDDDIAGGAGDDSLYGDDYEKIFSGNDKVSGGTGNDFIDGGAGNDVLSGDEGNDTLLGGEGDDRLTGGIGDDDLVGGAGNDTFVFERGSGADRIFTAGTAGGGLDVIEFGASVAAADLTYQLAGDDLIIRNQSTGDTIAVQDYFNPETTIDIHFSNGVVLKNDQLRQQLGVALPTMGTSADDLMEGTEGADSLYGGSGNDQLYGLGGNDYLNGGAGDDQLWGGLGNNVLEGGTGNDIYNIALGSLDRIVGLADADAGSDIIRFGPSYAPSMVTNYQIAGDDLYVFFLVNGAPSGVILEGFLAQTNGTHVIEFTDGTRLTVDNFLTSASHWTGTAANDVHVGSEANDTLDGGAGDDTLSGMGGNDTLYGGEGNDTLDGGDGDDVLRGGTGMDAVSGGAGNDQLYGDGSDTLSGGAGDDRYYIVSSSPTHQYGSSADRVVEAAGEGIDTVYVDNYSYSLSENVENLVAIYDPNAWMITNPTFPGWYQDIPRSFTGNALDNTITIENAPGWQTHAGHVYVLDGGAGADTLIGSDANETYVVDQVGDRIIETSLTSIDTVRASYSYTLEEGSRIEIVELSGVADLSAWGNSDKNILDGSNATGVNTLYGGKGDDRYIVDANDRVVELAGEGSDTVVVAASATPMTMDTTFTLDAYSNVENLEIGSLLRSDGWGGNILGNSADNVLTGNGYINTIHGGGGNDTIFGGERDLHSLSAAMHDFLFGDGGDDIIHAGGGGADLYGGTGDDQLYGAGNADDFHYALGDGTDTVHSGGGGGLDRVTFGENVTTDMVSFSRDGSTLIVQIGSNAHDQLRVANYWTDETSDVLSGEIGQFVFADGTIRKGGLDHLPYTNNPPVTLIGSVAVEAVGDSPFQFALPEGMFADAADDTLLLSLAPGAPAWLSLDPRTGLLTGTPPNGGLDTSLQLIATDSWGQTTSATVYLSVSNVIHGGAADDVLVGTTFRDDIYGGAGNDTIDGGGNTDRLFGGAGDDTYLIGDSSAAIVEFAGEGEDTVRSNVSYVLGDNVERLVLVEGSGATEGVGNALANDIVGNSEDNTLDGAGGADTLTGGLGNDTYIVDTAGDRIIESAGEGRDTVQASVDWQLGDNLEDLTLVGDADINGIGNGADNILRGNSGANRLEGGAGTDKLYGGLGNDYFVLESSADRAVEYEGEGTDTIERRYETNLVLETDVENLVLGAAVVTGNGNALDNAIQGNASANKLSGLDGNDTLYGLEGNDSLWGGNGQDALFGGTGDDYLDGGAGIDHLEGGLGDDVYVIGDASDVVVEAAGEGTDQVQATVSYTMADNLENLFLVGTGKLNGTGNASANYLAGNADDNVLSGMAGNDTLVGGGGSDRLVGGAGDDSYVVDAQSGSDTIDNTGGGFDGVFFNGIARERITFTRDGNDLLIFVDATTAPSVRVTNHFLGGDAAIDFVQPDGGSMLTTAQINQLVAGGSSGYDSVVEGTAAGEQLVGSTGKDLIKGLAGDDTLFGMGGNDTLQGGDGNDYLAGGNGSGTGSGDDRLEGGLGNDTLAGEDGNDTMIGGAGDDKYVYGGGQDVVDNTGGGYDGIFFNDGITASQLAFSRDGDDLLIKVNGDAAKTVRVLGHFLGGDSAIDYVQPASGNSLNTAAINALVGGGGTSPGGGTPSEPGNDADYTKTTTGTANGEQLVGTSGRDLIRGLAGNDTLFGMGGDDKLVGGDGDDYLSGGNGSFSGSGNDILVGGAGADTLVGEDGNDFLQGGAGDDKYLYKAGSGKDVIDNTGGGTDWLFFNDIDRTRLSFHRNGDDLIVLVDGDSNQQVRVQDHFKGGDLAISYVQPSDGFAIPASQFAGMLTPLPSGFTPAAASAASIMLTRALWMADAGTSDGLQSPSRASNSGELQRLVEAMSQSYEPRAGADSMMDEASWQNAAMLAMPAPLSPRAPSSLH